MKRFILPHPALKIPVPNIEFPDISMQVYGIEVDLKGLNTEDKQFNSKSYYERELAVNILTKILVKQKISMFRSLC